ncbi:membrane-bound transcription factor site-2 protease [Hyalella azteca]|uniref:Membrane-bound transcription factor site-2 protease n=1 Tax=Hyalella azteca TaxID=294128 RepID=A0A8B7PIQ4_HYAAZ|nr:membrane-bound transcription factor site-2 protease [Hyalella azteca]
MHIITALAIVAFVHVTLFVTDYILKSCLCLPYMEVVNHLGLVIKPFQLRVSTHCFNRRLAKWSYNNPYFIKLWMSLGVLVVLALIVPSIFLLAYNVVHWLATSPSPSDKPGSSADDTSNKPPLLQPIVPGVNLSSDELPTYIITLLISSVIHEAGHALAAVKEGVNVDGVGLIVLFILPGAFVLLPSDAMKSLRPFPKLKILCAGVWNNIALAGVALLLAHLLPEFSVLLYSRGRGAVVTNIFENSPARGPRGLFIEDIIQDVNGCAVKDSLSWHECLLTNLMETQRGFCVPDSVVSQMDETIEHAAVGASGAVTCCRKPRAESVGSDHLCFELLTDVSDDDAHLVPMHPFSCLPARSALSRSPVVCKGTTECPTDHYCLAPSVGAEERLLRIARTPMSNAWRVPAVTEASHGQRKLSDHHATADHDGNETLITSELRRQLQEVKGKIAQKIDPYVNTRSLNNEESQDSPSLAKGNDYAKYDYLVETDDGHTDDVEALPLFNDVLYLGSPALLFQTVKVSDYLPRNKFISLGWIEELQEVCLCFVKFSGALALMNMVPCIGFDGQFIADTLVEWSCIGRCDRNDVRIMKAVITAVGTALIALNILVGISSLSITDAPPHTS